MPDGIKRMITDEEFKEWVSEKWGSSKLPIGGCVPLAGSSKFFKTGDWAAKRPKLILENCISCHNCYFYCPDSAVIWKEDLDGDGKIEPKFDYDYCKGCGVCAHECPKNAIIMEDI